VSKKEQLKEDFEAQIRENKNRKLKAQEQRKKEEAFWEEKAKRENAALQKRYEAEKQLEDRRTIKSLATADLPKPLPDALDRLRQEIFKNDPLVSEAEPQTFLTAPSNIGYEDVQRQVREAAQAGEFYSADRRRRDSAPDPQQAQEQLALDGEGEEEHQPDPDPVSPEEKKRDYEEELAKFREDRAANKRDFGEVQRPFHEYLRDHQELYRLGDASETKVFDGNKVIKATPEELSQLLLENAQTSRRVPHARLRLTNNRSPPEDQLLSHLEAESLRRQQELTLLARRFRAEVLDSEMRQDYIAKETRALAQQSNDLHLKARMDGLTRDAAFKGLHLTLPKLDLLADVQQAKAAKAKYAAVFASSQQTDLPALVEWEYLKAKRTQDNLVGFYKGLSKTDLHWVDSTDEQLVLTLEEIDRLI